MGEENKVPTPGGQLLDFCLKTIADQQQIDANTMLALLSLVNLTNILELIGQGKREGIAGNTGVPGEVIQPGADKMGMLNNLMSMLGGSGDISKLMPLISMLGNVMKGSPQPPEAPPVEVKREEAIEEPEAEEPELKEPRAASGWARVGR
jgi:hypothetical protein